MIVGISLGLGVLSVGCDGNGAGSDIPTALPACSALTRSALASTVTRVDDSGIASCVAIESKCP
jgi:hypothetical protein